MPAFYAKFGRSDITHESSSRGGMVGSVLKTPQDPPILTLRIGRALRKVLWIQRRASSRAIVRKWHGSNCSTFC